MREEKKQNERLQSLKEYLPISDMIEASSKLKILATKK